MGDTQPRRVVVAGDWHGNTGWAVAAIRSAAEHLQGELRPVVLHLGDFGIWPGPGGTAYIDALERACAEHGVEIWFIDGNHEDFTQVSRFDSGRSESRWITHLPRGYRWEWHGRTWLALGGAASIDRSIRMQGKDWWPEEEITDDQAARVIADGPADVMLTHDCPSGVTHTFPWRPPWWTEPDIANSDAHREKLQRIVSAVQPGTLMHGHLHMAYQRMCDLGYGYMQVTGLDCDGGSGPNWAVLDVKVMTWGHAE